MVVIFSVMKSDKRVLPKSIDQSIDFETEAMLLLLISVQTSIYWVITQSYGFE